MASTSSKEGPSEPNSSSQFRQKMVFIEKLNKFTRGGKLCLQVDSVGAIKHYNKENDKVGAYFSFETSDSTGELRITAFNEACHLWHDRVRPGQLIEVVNFTVKDIPAMYRRDNRIVEVTLRKDSEIWFDPSTVDGVVPVDRWLSIADLEIVKYHKATVNVTALVSGVRDAPTKRRSDGESVPRRVVELCEPTLKAVELSLWGDTICPHMKDLVGVVVKVQRVCVSVYQDIISLNSCADTVVEESANDELMSWWKNEGQFEAFEIIHTNSQ